MPVNLASARLPSPPRPVDALAPLGRAALLCAAAVLVPACGDDDVAPPPPPPPMDGGADMATPEDRVECENLNPLNCLLPWPSSRYLVADPARETGFRVEIPREAMPRQDRNDPMTGVDPRELNRWDGFSAQTSFVTLHEGPIDDSALPYWMRVEDSLAPTSPTILLDATAGELLPHFAELDYHADFRDEARPLYIRPAVRMPRGHRIIVAIRNLRKRDGSPVRAHAPFAALRDGTATDAPGVDARRTYFENEIFAPLVARGVERASLIEAWDIVTGTDENAWGDAVFMRDEALRAVGDRGLGCTITAMSEPTMEESAEVFRRVEGTVTVPLFLTADEPGAPLRRDDAGRPVAMGTTEFPFLVIIPRSVAARVRAGEGPARLMQYGHGLFGGREEAAGSYVRGFANEFPTVVVAGDWVGMASADVSTAVATLTDMSKFATFVDRQVQGLVNLVVLTRTMKGRCADLPAFAIEEGGMARPVYDPGDVYYHGNSQGGIFGMTFAALSPDIRNFAVGVGAASYAVFMPRSTNWATYEVPLRAWYRNSVDRAVLLAMLAQLWERTDPSAFTPYILRDFRTGMPTGKRVLHQTGRWDAQVSNNGSDIAARNMGIPLYIPSIYPVFGLDTFTDAADSGYVIYETGGSMVPDDFRYAASEPRDSGPDGNRSVHEAVRRDPRARAQLDAFMRPDGRVLNFCDGPCDSAGSVEPITRP
jgi:hypothetical protein